MNYDMKRLMLERVLLEKTAAAIPGIDDKLVMARARELSPTKGSRIFGNMSAKGVLGTAAGMTVAMALAGLLSSAPKVIGAAGLSLTERADYYRMLNAHPDLKIEDKKRSALMHQMFRSLRHLNAPLSKDPVAAGSIIRTMLAQSETYTGQATGPNIPLSTILDLQKGSPREQSNLKDNIRLMGHFGD